MVAKTTRVLLVLLFGIASIVTVTTQATAAPTFRIECLDYDSTGFCVLVVPATRTASIGSASCTRSTGTASCNALVVVTSNGWQLPVGSCWATSSAPFDGLAPDTDCNGVVQEFEPIRAGAVTQVNSGIPRRNTSTVLMNIAMTGATTAGFVSAVSPASYINNFCVSHFESTFFPAPSTSNGNYQPGTAISNLSVVPVAGVGLFVDPGVPDNGYFCLYNQTAVHVVIDVQGSFGTPGVNGQVFVPTPPTRKLDTRRAPLARPTSGTITRINAGTPAIATSVLVNLTMTSGEGAGYITADKCSALLAGPQTRSNGNFPVDAAVANLSVVPLDPDGSFCIYNDQPVHLVVDMQGWFGPVSSSGLNFSPIPTIRKLDTRPARPLQGSITRVSTGLPLGTASAMVNLTMVDGAASGYVTADKCSTLVAGAQTKSNGNFQAGAAVANLSVVPLDADGSFCIYNDQAVNMVVDLQGSFSGSGSQQFFPAAPNRVLDTRLTHANAS
jgi:hypothetical protein